MFSESIELYDTIYSEFKDFEAEAAQVATLLREKCPAAKRLLDVGCGTGRHAAALVAEHGFQVDGLDIESGFLEIALLEYRICSHAGAADPCSPINPPARGSRWGGHHRALVHSWFPPGRSRAHDDCGSGGSEDLQGEPH